MRTKLSIFCDRVIEAGWLAAAVAVPLFFNIYTARTFEPDKITLLRSIVGVMILAWIISVVERGVSEADGSSFVLSEHFRRWLKTPLFLPTALLVLVYIISTIFSISPRVSLWGSYQRMQGTYSYLSYVVVFALMAGNLRTREQVDRLVTIIILASIPVGLYGIVQHYGLDPLPWAGDVTYRVASNMGNPIFVASYLIMIVPLTLSRLIEAMSAIIKEEKASWGYTILAAVYIFTLAIQVITILFSRSRGPLLGILGASFIMGLLILLVLRRLHPNPVSLSFKEIGMGFGFMALLGVAGGLGGGLGYLLGWGLDNLLLALNYSIGGVSLMGAALGGLLGFLGLYTYMAATEKGWRWLWLSWFGLAVLGVIFVLALNIRGIGLDPYLDPIRRLPYLERLANITETQATGRVRVLIWDSAMRLVAPHEPLGIPGDEVSPPDKFNLLRPLLGYGPDSMFNAFAFVYPPNLVEVENRGSSADRSHNETMDSLVITGVLGFLAFYFLMTSLFYYALLWLGWVPDKPARWRLIILLLAGSVAGLVAPYLLDAEDSPFTFMPLGLPLGLIAGVVIHLVWQAIVTQKENKDRVEFSAHPLLLIGLLGALIGHFIEVHFVFSIAATYTYFWIYAGLMVALSRINQIQNQAEETTTKTEAELGLETGTMATLAVEPEEPAFLDYENKVRRPKKRRTRRRTGAKTPGANACQTKTREAPAQALQGESWAVWVGSQGLAMAIILIILTFDFITPHFVFSLGDKDSLSLLWMYVITWYVGLAIALSDTVIRWQEYWDDRATWLQILRRIAGFFLWPVAFLLFVFNIDKKYTRLITLYAFASLSYFFIHYLTHTFLLGVQVMVTRISDVITAANVLVWGLLSFYGFLFVLFLILALVLAWRQMRGQPFLRAENWWLYPPLILAIFGLIWFKNINVVRADLYLKDGERYRNQGQWDQAIALHERGKSIDSDEDFYYLMLALDYQLMAQDGNVDAARRQQGWQKGEEIALEARRINPYNPDNTGNMGRYYFTLGQVFDPGRFSDALEFFEKATILAPSNVIYHNLWAQTHYIRQNYDAAIDRLKKSIAIDSRYPPTWLLLGDTYAALGNVDEALKAHREAMKLPPRYSDPDGFSFFADQFLDQRLNFYVSAGRLDDIVAAMQQVALDREEKLALAADDETRKRAQQRAAQVQCTIGRAYLLAGQYDQATLHLEQCRALGDNSDRTIRDLANIYLNSEAFDQALPLYLMLVQNNSNDVEAHSALAFIHARQGRLQEAIQENQLVLQQLPNDYDSLKNLAVLYQQLGQWPEALRFAQQAQTVAPESDQPSWQQFIADIESQMPASE
ncbi:MAG: tetratricopeptide repeat protein [Anaerolineae bacterium]|nr:tetratricopeptide repeat protein [Anaerolineae bacterium]